MGKLRTTLGQLAVNEMLPESLRDYSRQLDRKALDKVLSRLASESPEKYREISHRLSLFGIRVAEQTGGFTFGPRHLRMAESAKQNRIALKKELDALLDDDSLDANARNAAVINLARKYQAGEPAKVYQESLAEKNPLALQILSGSRGNPSNLASLRASSLLFADAKDEPVPIAVMRSYSQGLSPSEYWAATYGGRRSVMTTKLGIADSGYMGKQLVRVAHRLLVTARDSDQEPDASSPIRGLPADTDDTDNEGSLLAQAVGGFARNTILTPKILTQLQKKGVKRILVRSPMVGGPDDGGVYARDVGVREFGRLPTLHEPVGISAAQSVGERLSQVALSSKHSGGVAGGNKLLSGMPLFKALINTPKVVKGGATHSTVDGKVERLEPGPAGGQYVWIAGKRHFIGQGLDPHVKPGDTVEAGDVLSEGIPNPAAIVEHKGIGEGRRYFTKLFGDSLRGAGIGTHRRNIELLSRGLINHVELLDEIGEGVPGDVMPYQSLESTWQPRPGAKPTPVKQAVGKYLERPVLHYSIGTPLRPSVIRELEEFGVQSVDAHDDPPPFKSTMIRADTMLQYDPDFMTRMYGSHLRKSFLGAVHRGGSSDAAGTSFVPALAKGVDFGRYGKVQTPKTAPPLQGWSTGDPLQTEVEDFKPPKPSFKQAASELTLAYTIDRPKDTKKTFHTPDGDKEVTYPVDYGYFDDIFNPDDMEEADIFVGTGDLCGRFMKGDNLSGTWKPDERKWYVNLTEAELEAVKDMYRGDADDKNATPSLLRDWVRFESPAELQRDVQLLPQRDRTKQADWSQLLPILLMLGSAGVANLPALLQFFGLKGLLNGKGTGANPGASPGSAGASSGAAPAAGPVTDANTRVATPEELAKTPAAPPKTWARRAWNTLTGVSNTASGVAGTAAGVGGTLLTLPSAAGMAVAQNAVDAGDWVLGRGYRAPGSAGAALQPWSDTVRGVNQNAIDFTNKAWEQAARGLSGTQMRDDMGRAVVDTKGKPVYAPSTALNDYVATQVADMRHRGDVTGSTFDKTLPALTEAAYGTGQSAMNAALFSGAGQGIGAATGAFGSAAAPFASPGVSGWANYLSRGLGSTYNYMMTSPTGAVLNNFSPSADLLGQVPGVSQVFSPEVNRQAGDYYRHWGEQQGGFARYLGHGVGTVREITPSFIGDNMLFRGGLRGLRAAPASPTRTLAAKATVDAAKYTQPSLGVAAMQGTMGSATALVTPRNTQAYAPQGNNEILPLSSPTVRPMPLPNTSPSSPSGGPKPVQPPSGQPLVDHARASVPGF